MKDYYKTLGIDKNASSEDIKKAFRKMAHQYHPDKTKNDPVAAGKFKEASEAYSVLSDDAKRKQYDTFGSEGPGGGGFSGGRSGGGAGQGGFGGFNPNDFGGFDFSGFQQGGQGGVEFDLGDIFGDFFGGGRSTGSPRGSSRPAAAKRGRDISVDIQLTFEESIFGVEKTIHVNKASKCLTCEGSGAAPHSGTETCKTCKGQGKINETRRSFIGVFNTIKVCDTCHGMGQVPKIRCTTCHGNGVVERDQEISVKIPGGIEDGQAVRLSSMGEAVPFGVSGDLYIKVHVRQHSHIRKEKLNLITELGIKLTLALTGGDITLKTLDGDVILKIPEGTNTGDVLRIKGRGVPSDRGKRGDLLVRIHVDIPKKLSRETRRLIEELKREGL